jgi:ABC-type antimicrobial peptide transport system permease subunit
MFLRETMRLGALGLGVGALAAWGLARFLQALLYGFRANDPRILAASIAFLALVTSIACLAPALRAMRVDPITALRDE